MDKLSRNNNKIDKLDLFMKEILKDNTSSTKKEIYEQYKDIINDILPIDLFYLDMYKQSTTYSIEEIIKNADKFVNVFHQGLSRNIKEKYSHAFFDSLIKESNAIDSHLGNMKKLFKNKQLEKNKKELIKNFNVCLQFEKKFIKEENILFSRLEESIPSTMPLQVLWTLHDEARKLIRVILEELNKNILDEDKLIILIGEYYYLMYGISQKVQLIIIPVAQMIIPENILNKMYSETFEYGYALIDIEPNTKYLEEDSNLFNGEFITKTGSLSLKEIDLIFAYLPIDITFVDKDDKVKYFNNRTKRHFPRNPSVIGRLVKYCHPPKSVEVVEKIIKAFKSGDKDFAEFWITFNNVSLYITYHAVRDKNKNYIGILEMSQDISRIKELKGSKRLLDWE